MGYELARAAAAAAVAISGAVAGCGGASDDPPDALDVARSLAGQTVVSSVPSGPAGTAGAARDELPPPDRSLFVGSSRVLNLWVSQAGTTLELDVWGRRTASTGPVLLASALRYSELTAPFAVPPDYTVEAVGAGAGADGMALAEVFPAGRGERVLTIISNDGADGFVSEEIVESDPVQPGRQITAPAEGHGVLVLRVLGLATATEALEAAGSGVAFHVADPAGECIAQRTVAQGGAPEPLTATRPVEIEVPGETLRLRLVSARDPSGCAGTPVARFDIPVPVGATVLGLVHLSPGGGTSLAITTLALDPTPSDSVP